jgi:hypothetical protein
VAAGARLGIAYIHVRKSSMKVELLADDEAYRAPAEAFLRLFARHALQWMLRQGLLPAPPATLSEAELSSAYDLLFGLLATLEDEGRLDVDGVDHFRSLVFHDRLIEPTLLLVAARRTVLHGRLDDDLIIEAHARLA